MQALFSCYISDENTDYLHYQKDLIANINYLYDVYLYLLTFIKEMASFAEKYDDEMKANLPFEKVNNPNQRFYSNSLILSLQQNKILDDTCLKNKIFFNPENIDLLRKVFVDLKNNEVYKEYIKNEDSDLKNDFEILAYFLKFYTTNFTLLDQHLEDLYINWFDDAKISVNMAVKSLKIILSDIDESNILIPFTSEADSAYDFAIKLFKTCVSNRNTFNNLITQKIDKWEPSRIPLLDVVILNIGLAEFLYFDSIPVKVTINECIELAKNYSTTNSKKFINGVLDNLLIELEKSGQISKKGIGLIDN